HPSILFAHDEELPAVMNRLCFRQSTKADSDEGIIVIAPHLLNSARSRAGVGEKIVVRVLQAIELLDEECVSIGPLDARNVVLARIPGDTHPLHASATISIHYANAHGRICCSCQWIRNLHLHRIRSGLRIWNLGDDLALLAKVVHEREVPDAMQVELPERNSLPVRAPTKTVVQSQLFLIHPVGAAIDDKGGAIVSESLNRSAREVFDIDIVVLDVGGLGRL